MVTSQVDGAGREAERLAAAAGDRYDRVVRLAQAIFDAPIVALNLVGRTEQYTVSAFGGYVRRLPLDLSLCAFTMQFDGVHEVPDLRADSRFRDYPMVARAPHVGAYAGVPLRLSSGQKVGVLCIFDTRPNHLTRRERDMLEDLGALVERELAQQYEMLRAGDVQQLLLPRRAPALAGVEVAGAVESARQTGGDFFDWQVVSARDGAESLQVVLADVMGKGLPASLLASEMRAVLRAHSRYADLDDAVRRTADTTYPDLDANSRFVTLWTGRLDPADGTLHYVDAGHGLAALVSARGVRRLAQEHLPLGTPFLGGWTQATTTMAPDETLVVVSDGVLDVAGSIEAAMAEVQQPAVDGATCAEVVEAIKGFAAVGGATDDVTAVVVRRT